MRLGLGPSPRRGLQQADHEGSVHIACGQEVLLSQESPRLMLDTLLLQSLDHQGFRLLEAVLFPPSIVSYLGYKGKRGRPVVCT